MAGGVLLALAVGFFTGRMSSGGRGGSPLDAAAANTVRNFPGERPQSANEGAARKGRVDQDRTPPAAGTRAVSHALQAVDPVARTQLMARLLAKMDAGNFRDLLAEAERASTELGREHNEDWILMSIRAGQVGGTSAMDEWKTKGLDAEPAVNTFYGWATADPVAALKWLEQQGEISPGARAKLLNALTTGAVAFDPDHAEKLLASLPEVDRMNCLRGFTASIVDSGGRAAAIDWLASVQSADKDGAYPKSVEKQVFDRFMLTGAHRGSAAAMVTALEQLAPVLPLDESWIVRGMGQILQMRATGGIEMMDQIAKSPVLQDLPLTDRAWQSAVGNAIQRNPDAVGKWLADHPTSPIFGKVSEMMER